MKKLFWGLLLALPLFLLVPTAQAFSLEIKDNYQLPNEETYIGNLYVLAEKINIAGEIEGDLVAIAQTLTVEGKIAGDLIAITQNLSISGEITGSVRVLSQFADIKGLVERNVNLFATTVNLSPESEIGSDLLVFGAQGNFSGLINDSLYGGLGQAIIDGRIGRDVSLRLGGAHEDGGLFVGPNTVIGGDLKYSSQTEAEIQNPEAIYGNIEHQPLVKKTRDWKGWAMNRFLQLAALILIGIVLLTLKRKSFLNLSETIKKEPWRTPLIGLLVLLFTPVVASLLFVSVVGVPLSLIILALYLILLGISVIYSSYFLGLLLMGGLRKNKTNPFLVLILGLFLFIALSSIPWVGKIIILIFALYGLGGLALELKKGLTVKVKN